MRPAIFRVAAMDIDALAFDAYGTLFDVFSVQQRAEAVFPGHGQAISEVWRRKQLEYTWLRSLMDAYEDFWDITRDALVYAVKSTGSLPEPDKIEAVLNQYLELDLYPEVPEALGAMGERRLSILSNGNLEMLEPAVRHAGLNETIGEIISADAVRIFKPDARVYALGPQTLGVPAGRTLFVSSNPWDVAGAKHFGYQVAWIRRKGGQLDELGLAPDHIVSELTELLEVLD